VVFTVMISLLNRRGVGWGVGDAVLFRVGADLFISWIVKEHTDTVAARFLDVKH
jgi:hypothetical protein